MPIAFVQMTFDSQVKDNSFGSLRSLPMQRRDFSHRISLGAMRHFSVRTKQNVTISNAVFFMSKPVCGSVARSIEFLRLKNVPRDERRGQRASIQQPSAYQCSSTARPRTSNSVGKTIGYSRKVRQGSPYFVGVDGIDLFRKPVARNITRDTFCGTGTYVIRGQSGSNQAPSQTLTRNVSASLAQISEGRVDRRVFGRPMACYGNVSKCVWPL